MSPRKKDEPAMVPILIRLTAEQLQRVDNWRRVQDSIPTRSEAIRAMMEIGLDQEGISTKRPKSTPKQ
jgi:hypothetical protein